MYPFQSTKYTGQDLIPKHVRKIYRPLMMCLRIPIHSLLFHTMKNEKYFNNFFVYAS